MLIFAALVGEDALNGRIALGRIPPGLTASRTLLSKKAITAPRRWAAQIFPIPILPLWRRTKDYFVFLMGKNHGHVFDKASLSGGTPEEFRRFIEDKTGLTVQTV